MKNIIMKMSALLFLFIFFLVSSPPSRSEEKKYVPFTGIMLFLNSAKEAIIVAPTLNEKKFEAGQTSCERKKSYLEKIYGMKARIIADKDLTDTDKKANLIIVGKENGLLKEIWQKTPIRPTPDSFFFNGEENTDPREYIVFTQVNPFNESTRILVCASIDPDIDKIKPFPQIGSDWVIMRDCSLIRQGRFYGGTSLPPGSDPYAEFSQAGEIDGFYKDLTKSGSQFYEIYYPSDLQIKDKIGEGGKKRDTALLDILKKIGAKPPEKKFKIFLYKDKEQKKNISGVSETIHFIDGKKEVHMVAESLLTNSRHEDAHVVAGFILSDNASVQATEGFAIYIDSIWKSKPLAFWSGFTLKLGKLPSVSDLLDEGKFIRYSMDYSFPLIGSLVTTFIEKYGIEKFKDILGQEKVTDSSLRASIGQNLAQLETIWISDIKAKSEAYIKDIDFAVRNDAARVLIEKRDFSAATKELMKALEIIPDEPQALFNLASAYVRVPDLKAAETTLLKLLSLNLPESNQHFISFGHYQLGRVYDLLGNREKAVAEYKKVLSLPDMFDSHRQAKDRIDRPASQYDFE